MNFEKIEISMINLESRTTDGQTKNTKISISTTAPNRFPKFYWHNLCLAFGLRMEYLEPTMTPPASHVIPKNAIFGPKNEVDWKYA